MTSGKAPPDRCGHTKDMSQFPGPPGSVTCWRVTWQYGRCIWHDDSEQKPVQQLMESRTDHPERLDDAILRRIGLGAAISFRGCNLADADFTQSSINGADFREAYLPGAEFQFANLPGADFSGAYLHGASLKGANLTNATLDETKISDVTILEDVSISEGTSFKGKSGWEHDADKTAIESSLAAKYLTSRLSVFGRGRSDPRDFEYAARQYRLIQQLLREHYLHQSTELTVREKNVRRKQAFAEGDYLAWLKLAFYRWPLGYGERLRNVIATSAVTIIGFGVLYPLVGGIQSTSRGSTSYAFYPYPENFLDVPQWVEILGANLYFSTVTFTTLGYGDIQPTSPIVQSLAGIESLTGALLMAFLVFVLGRRATW